MPNKRTDHKKLLVFPRASKRELAEALLEELGDDYFLYESFDVIEAIGPAIQNLLLKGKEVNVPYLGTFVLKLNPEKEYYNVHQRQRMFSHGSVGVKFRLSKKIKDEIGSGIKRLLIQTMRLQPDVPLDKSQNIL